jgi:YidC/Oxa1 family membrane protein insertase
MKMNRTEWIVVILCAAALAWMMTRQPEHKPDAKPDAAQKTTPATPETTPEAPPVPALEPVKEETVVINSGAAEYTFTNIGGALQQVKILPARYAGRTEQLINSRENDGAVEAIGALSTGPGVIEKLSYSVESKSDRSIIYANTTNGLKITKKWELAEVPEKEDATDGYGYVWNLTVTFTNTAEAQQAGQYWLYSGLLGRLHGNDWIQPSLTWYADDDAEEMDFTAFDESSGFLGIGAKSRHQQITKDLTEMTFAGVHNQYYAVLIQPESVKKESSAKVWAQRQWITFKDGEHGDVSGHGMESGVGMDPFTLTKDQSYTWKGRIYTGPRSGTVLNRLGGELRQAMHYGWFRTLSRLFLGLLNTFHGWIGTYGVAIMLLTLFVRICIWPLHIKATRAMKRMGKLAPMMKDIREKHKDDPQRMNMEVMKLYREYGVNPLGGCLPLLFQFPIFLGYYNMMKSAVEMRGHSFLWVNDLSMPDTVVRLLGIPVNPLPILMTVTMYLQMKIAPQPGLDANPQMQMQMKIFKVMPLLFMVFCYNFASALSLYWTVQNIISIGQTWLMQRQPEVELKKVPPRPSFMERAMAAQQARQREQQQKKGPRPPRTGGGAGSAWRSDVRKK